MTTPTRDELKQAAETILDTRHTMISYTAGEKINAAQLLARDVMRRMDDSPIDEAFLRENGFKLLIYPVFCLGGQLIDLDIHLGNMTAKVGSVSIKCPRTRGALLSLLDSLGWGGVE